MLHLAANIGTCDQLAHAQVQKSHKVQHWEGSTILDHGGNHWPIAQERGMRIELWGLKRYTTEHNGGLQPCWPIASASTMTMMRTIAQPAWKCAGDNRPTRSIVFVVKLWTRGHTIHHGDSLHHHYPSLMSNTDQDTNSRQQRAILVWICQCLEHRLPCWLVYQKKKKKKKRSIYIYKTKDGDTSYFPQSRDLFSMMYLGGLTPILDSLIKSNTSTISTNLFSWLRWNYGNFCGNFRHLLPVDGALRQNGSRSVWVSCLTNFGFKFICNFFLKWNLEITTAFDIYSWILQVYKNFLQIVFSPIERGSVVQRGMCSGMSFVYM